MTRVHYQSELLRSICEGAAVIDLTRIDAQTLSTEPYSWAFIGELFSPSDAAALVESYPEDSFKTLIGSDGEKGWEYEARSLIHMGASAPSHPENLSREWQQLADDLVSPGYREAMSRLTGLDLTASPIEVNVFHYGPGAWMGPHKDLADKIVTHILYFNEEDWDPGTGGCLAILRSSEMSDVETEIPPVVGNSAVLVRSEQSWHAVSRVADGSSTSRRSVTVTFYKPGAVSTMWPPGEETPLHRYAPAAA
jgi:SM-20-related protein